MSALQNWHNLEAKCPCAATSFVRRTLPNCNGASTSASLSMPSGSSKIWQRMKRWMRSHADCSPRVTWYSSSFSILVSAALIFRHWIWEHKSTDMIAAKVEFAWVFWTWFMSMPWVFWTTRIKPQTLSETLLSTLIGKPLQMKKAHPPEWRSKALNGMDEQWLKDTILHRHFLATVGPEHTARSICWTYKCCNYTYNSDKYR